MSKQINYKGIVLHPGQKRIVDEIFANDKFFNTIVTSRQWGKSVLAYNLMLYYGINNKKVNVVWASPTHSQAKYALTNIEKAIKNSGVILSINKTERRIELINGSTLYFTGTESFDNFRGINTHYLFVDEAAYVPTSAYDVLIPSMSTVGRKAFFISTPKGKVNKFHDYYQLGLQEDNKMYKSYRGLLEENPYRNVELIESERLSLPSYIFEQEYNGNFLDSEFSLFKNLNAVAIGNMKLPQANKKYYAGLDLGRTNDYTVLTILDENKEVVKVYRDRQKSWNVIINNVVNNLKQYNNAHCFVESNSIGDVVYELIKKQYNNAYPFGTYSNKPQLIESLIVEFEQQHIIIPNKNIFPELYNELSSFEFKYSPKQRTVQYSAPPGLNDDTVMSLALANLCYKKYNKAQGLIIGY